MPTVTDDRIDILVNAIKLIHGGDGEGEDQAREVAPHLCWDGAADIVSDQPHADPMEPGELRTELDNAFALLTIAGMDDHLLSEHIREMDGVRWVTWDAAEGYRDDARSGVRAICVRILFLSDRERCIARNGLVGHYLTPVGV